MGSCREASEVELTNRSLRSLHIADGSETKRRISGKRRMGCQGRPQRSKRGSIGEGRKLAAQVEMHLSGNSGGLPL